MQLSIVAVQQTVALVECQSTFPRSVSMDKGDSFLPASILSAKIKNAKRPLWLSRLTHFPHRLHSAYKSGKLFRHYFTFYRLHVTYFIVLDLVGTLFLWFSPKPSGPISFIDSLYSSTSALTVTGLTCLHASRFSIADKILFMILMILGSHWFTSLLPVFIRRYVFRLFLSRANKEVHSAVQPIPTVANLETNLWTSDSISVGESASGLSTLNYWRGGALKVWLDARMNDSPLRYFYPNTSGNVLSPRQLSNDPQNERSLGSRANELAAKEIELKQIMVSNMDSSNDPKQRGLDPLVQAETPKLGEMTAVGHENSQQGNDSSESGTIAENNPPSITSEVPHGVQPIKNESDGTAITLGKLLSESSRRTGFQVASTTARSLFSRLKNLISAKSSIASPGGSLARFHSTAVSPPSLDFDELSLDNDILECIPVLEYKSLQMLSYIVLLFGMLSIFVGFVLLCVCLLSSDKERALLSSNGLNPTFFCLFISVSAFANGGLTLLDTNLMPFQENGFFMLVLCVLILVGNTMLAPVLRGIIYCLHALNSNYLHLLRNNVALKYLLDEPRKCFTHLFTRNITLWLIFTVVSINLFEFLFFLILDWNLQALSHLSSIHKITAGLFQSISTRTAGFNIISIPELSPPMFVLYAATMYIAVYPVYLSRQKTKVKRTMEDYDPSALKRKQSALQLFDTEIFAQGRHMIGHDYVILFFFICLISLFQDSNIRSDSSFTLFNIIFEVFSAYGNVGLSLGYHCGDSNDAVCQNPPYSFSGVWKTPSKLIIIIVMILGRQRGLPDNVDAAITIPKRKFFEARSTFGGSKRSLDFNFQHVEHELSA